MAAPDGWVGKKTKSHDCRSMRGAALTLCTTARYLGRHSLRKKPLGDQPQKSAGAFAVTSPGRLPTPVEQRHGKHLQQALSLQPAAPWRLGGKRWWPQ